jgi:hypothetical protein
MVESLDSNIKQLSLEEVKDQYTFLWLLLSGYNPHISDAAIARIISIVMSTCPYCWNYLKPCNCTRTSKESSV